VPITRREFTALAAAAIAVRPSPASAGTERRARIRAITAGVSLDSLDDRAPLERAWHFLEIARAGFEADGWVVQTTRIATQPLGQYAPAWASSREMKKVAAIDRLCADRGISLSLGPVMTTDAPDPDFSRKAAEFVAAAPSTNFSVLAASAEQGVHRNAVRAAAQAIVEISRTTARGAGNFNFAATALCPPGTPFFPAAYHQGEDAYAIGLESANLVSDAVRAGGDAAGAPARIRASLGSALAEAARRAEDLSARTGRRYDGVDASPAPSLDASIGGAVESLSGVPFGDPGTLQACAALTGVLKTLAVKTCGYSGLMLPVLEDRVLARRAGERRFSLSELLLFSSVCGTGLDVAPLPGDVPVEILERLVGDVAALAVKHGKPLSARLLPTPGKAAGELARFDNPHLVDAIVMEPR
jgi:uncharacterized protein